MRKHTRSGQHIRLHDASGEGRYVTVPSMVLVVEDDDDMRRLIRATLKGDPHLEFCGEATTATEAIALARAAGPDVVVLNHFVEGDIMGLQAAPMIHAVAPEAKILLFTSHDLAAEAAREPAVDAFLSKTKAARLLPTVQRLLGLEAIGG